jgi:mono/diheme cytochrome c family protein
VISAKTAAKWGVPALAVGLAMAPLGQLLAQAAAAPAPAAAGNAEKGKALFENSSCGACHVLSAAGASGEIGPSLDKNALLTHDLLVSRMKNGQGAMPAYAGQLSDADIEDVTAYVLSAAAK